MTDRAAGRDEKRAAAQSADPADARDAVVLVRVAGTALVLEGANGAGRALLQLDEHDDADLVTHASARALPVLQRIRAAAERGRASREQVALGGAAVEIQLEPLVGGGDDTRVLAVIRSVSEIDLAIEDRTPAAPAVGVFRTEHDLGAVFVDDALLQLLSLSHEQALGRGWLDAIHRDDRDAVARALADAATREDALDVECRIRRGVEERWARVHAVPVRGDDGLVTGCLGSIADVTEQHQSLRASERLVELADAAEEMIGVCDAAWRIVFLNPAAQRRLGLQPGTPLTEIVALDFFSGEDAELAEEIGAALELTGRWQGELLLHSLDGRRVEADCTVLSHTAPNGEVDHYSFLGRDVTVLHDTERALRASEERFRLISESSTVGIVFIAPGGLIEYANPRIAEILGKPIEEVVGQAVLSDVHPDDLARLGEEGAGANAEARESSQEFRIVRPSGETRWLRAHGAPVLDHAGHVRGFVGSVIDTTDEHTAQRQLLRLQETLESTTDLVTFHDNHGQMFFANAAARAFFGLSPDAPLPALGPADFLDVSEEQLAEIGTMLEQQGRWAGELDCVGAKTRLPASIVVTAHRDERGETEYFSALSRDVSERRTIEAKVASAAAWFQSLVQHAPDLLAVLNGDGTVKYVSPSVERLLGRRPEDLIGTRLGSLLSDRQVTGDDVTGRLAREPGVPVHFEGKVRLHDGSPRWFEGTLTNLLDDPTVAGVVLHARDITARRESDAARRRSEAALRSVVQSSPLPIFALDRSGTVHIWNVACEQLFGWSAREVVGGRPPFFTGDLELEHLLDQAFAGETVTGFEGRVTRVDGSLVDVDVAIAPLRDHDDRVITAVVVLADVTERKLVRRELAESERRFRSLVQHSSDMVTVIDSEGSIRYMSPTACAFIGRGLDDLVGLPPPRVVHPDDEQIVASRFAKLRSDPGSTQQLTFRMKRCDSVYRWIEMAATNLLDDPAVLGLVLNSRDISDRVEGDAAIRASEARLRALVASASDIISVIDSDGKLKYSSPVTQVLLGYAEGEGYGRDIFEIIHPEDRPRIVELFAHVPELRGMYRPLEVRLQHADGSWLEAEIVANNLLDDPSVQGIVLTTRDISKRKQNEEALRASEQRLREREAHYRAVVDDQTELVCRYLPDTTMTFVNRAFAEFYGRSPAELAGSRLIDLFPSTERRPELQRLRAFGHGNEVQTQEDWELALDGSVHWYQWTDRAFLDDDGNVLEFQSVGRDVSDRRRGAVLTAHQAEILEQVARGVPLDETLTTIARTVEDHFPKLVCTITLLDEDGMTLRIGAAPSLPIRFRDAMDSLRIGPVSCSGGTAAYRREAVYVADVTADPLWVERRDAAQLHGFCAAWSIPVLGSDGHTVLGTLDAYSRTASIPDEEHQQIVSLLAHLASIAIERKAFEERLAHQSMHDPLTGLPNRLLFLDRLSLAVARCRRTHTQVAVLFLDLDRFKNVNDSVGHDAGDELLIAVARRLESVLRPGDTVARFGGDEFTILCEDLPYANPREQAIEIAHRLLTAVAQPFVVRGAETFVSASLGISIAAGEERPEELLRDADAAMYHAKEAGRGRVEVFDDKMRERALERHATENALHRALERGEFSVFFQPVVSLRTARCVGAEALVRWQHPERGLIGPSEFVPLAEETGLVVELGAWVLEQAAQQLAQWQLEHDQPFVVSVNLSACQLAQPDLADNVAEIIDRTGILPSNLCLEITESVLMDDAEAVIAVIERVRALGIRLAIDDFGTGYSSLGYLKRFPVDLVKIDRSFVDGLGTDAGDAAIVSAVIGLAHALDLRVIAEGVETEPQLAELLALGCDEAQGYFFAPPQPIQDLRTLIGRNRAWRPPGSLLMTATPRSSGLRRGRPAPST
ncbi:MAG: PAS domain S-box protein [Actinomycetota bacterium]